MYCQTSSVICTFHLKEFGKGIKGYFEQVDEAPEAHDVLAGANDELMFDLNMLLMHSAA